MIALIEDMSKQFKIFLIIVWSIILLMFVGILLLKNGSDKNLPKRQVVITFNDLPASRGNLEQMRIITGDLLKAIVKYDIPAIGFVSEAKLYLTDRPEELTKLINKWVEVGLELGNNSYSHMDPNVNSLETYQKDIIKGEQVSGVLLKNVDKNIRYFRHPFLNVGPTPEYEQKLNQFLKERSYTIAPVTHQNREWKYAAVYSKAKERSDTETMEQIAESYIAYMGTMFAYWESVSIEAAGYEIPQILLLHVNHLNADHFTELVKMMKKRGYSFITMEAALADRAYSLPQQHTTEEYSWLYRWLLAQDKPLPPAPEEHEFIAKMYSKEIEETY